MNRRKALIFLNVLFILYSCHSNKKLQYEEYKVSYHKAVNCLLSNYNTIFITNGTKNPVDIYNSQRINNRFCKSDFQKLDKKLLTVACYKDSTIFFYSFATNRIKSKQSILVFTNDINKLHDKMTSDMKLISKKDSNWYQLERVISIAN